MKTRIIYNRTPWRADLPLRWLWVLLPAAVPLFYISTEYTLCVILALLAMAPPAGKLSAKLSRKPPALRRLPRIIAVFILMQTVTGLLLWLSRFVMGLADFEFQHTQNIVRLFQNSNTSGKIFIFLTVTTLVPLTEELLFRRILFGFFRHFTGGITAAVICSLLFALAHRFPAGALSLFWIGMCLQYMYCRSGSFLTPVIMHSMINICGCIMAL